MELSPIRSSGPKYFNQNFQNKVKDRLFGSMMKHYICLSRQILIL